MDILYPQMKDFEIFLSKHQLLLILYQENYFLYILLLLLKQYVFQIHLVLGKYNIFF